jgi:hypothetical protein
MWILPALSSAKRIGETGDEIIRSRTNTSRLTFRARNDLFAHGASQLEDAPAIQVPIRQAPLQIHSFGSIRRLTMGISLS